MKRRNTADSWLIEKVAELKKNGIDFFLCETTYTTKSGKEKTLRSVTKSTAAGISAYANNMYLKYGDSMCVTVGYFDKAFNWHTLTTYHA